MKKLFTILIILATMAANAQHSVTLKNGTVYVGTINAIYTTSIMITDDKGTAHSFLLSDVDHYNNSGNATKEKPNQQGTSAGDELIKATNKYYTGMAITMVGLITSTAGSYAYGISDNADANTQKAIVYAGIGVTIIGAIINISAFSNIAKAGHKLNAIAGKDGVGISMKF